MKKTQYILSSLFILSLVAGCSAPIATIDLNSVGASIDIHTDAQKTFLDLDDASRLDSSIKGLEELSRPKPLTISWTGTNTSNEYKVVLSEKSDLSDPMEYVTKDSSIDIYNLKVGTKYYYRVEDNKNDEVTSEKYNFTTKRGVRNLYVDGVTNVRDMGGAYLTEEGKYIKQGLLFRGARLNNSYPKGSGDYGNNYALKDTTAEEWEREITDKGIETFKELGIINEIDLRAPDGNGFPGGAGIEQVHDNVEGVHYNPFPMTKSDPLYNTGNKTAVKNVFDKLKDESNYPLYFHCNIGTNRTGTIAMLVLALCGVYGEDLLKDYMFSNFGTICVSWRQYDKKEEKRAEITDVTKTNEVYDRLVKASGSTMSEKAITVLGQAGVTRETCLAVRSILLGND